MLHDVLKFHGLIGFWIHKVFYLAIFLGIRFIPLQFFLKFVVLSQEASVRVLFEKIAELRSQQPPGRGRSKTGWDIAEQEETGEGVPAVVEENDIHLVPSPKTKSGDLKTPEQTTSAGESKPVTSGKKTMLETATKVKGNGAAKPLPSSASGRSSQQKELDLLDTEILELEGELKSGPKSTSIFITAG